MIPGIVQIVLEGQNDERLTVHGQGAGDRGVYLSKGGVDTLLTTAPEKQTWKSGARSKGSKLKNRKILEKDIDLDFLVKETEAHTSEQNESYLLQAVGWELDEYYDDAKYARVVLTTDVSGTRYLDLVQYEEPDYDPEVDPIQQQFGALTLKVRCGDPDWYEDDWVSAYEFDAPGEGFVEVWNPTPRKMLQTWGFTEGVWTIPDFSWRGAPNQRYPGGPDSGRFITTPEILATDGYSQLHRDRDLLAAENEHETNILARFQGQYLVYEIPPYTQKQRLPVFFDSGSAGRIELIQPRRWPRGFGGEFIG